MEHRYLHMRQGVIFIEFRVLLFPLLPRRDSPFCFNFFLYQEMEGREGGSGLVNRDQLLVHLTKQQEARLVKQNHQKEEFDRDLISSQLYTFNKLQKNLAEPCKT